MWPWRARRERRERELESEIQAHLDLEAAELLDAGAEDPRMAAQRAFGNVAVVREKVRDEWGWTPIEQVAQDVRYAFRTMWRSPGFTAATVVSLALGIGTDAAIFSFADAVVLRPLAIRDPDSLLVLRSTSPETPTGGISYPRLQGFQGEKSIVPEACRSPSLDPAVCEGFQCRAPDAHGHAGELGFLPGARRRAGARPRLSA